MLSSFEMTRDMFFENISFVYFLHPYINFFCCWFFKLIKLSAQPFDAKDTSHKCCPPSKPHFLVWKSKRKVFITSHLDIYHNMNLIVFVINLVRVVFKIKCTSMVHQLCNTCKFWTIFETSGICLMNFLPFFVSVTSIHFTFTWTITPFSSLICEIFKASIFTKIPFIVDHMISIPTINESRIIFVLECRLTSIKHVFSIFF